MFEPLPEVDAYLTGSLDDLASSAENDTPIGRLVLLWRCYEFQQARQVIDQLVNDPETPLPHLQVAARLLFQAGRFEQSADLMRQTHERAGDEERITCLEQLASCLERSNQIDESLEVLDEALRLNPTSPRAVRLLAHIDKRNGAYGRAIERLKRQLAEAKTDYDWELRYELAASLDRVGDYDDAWQQLLMAKAELQQVTPAALRRSYAIRKRQGELVKRVTDADLDGWRNSDPDGRAARIAILAGFPRSGTTLLEQILTAHEECVGTDETAILTTQFSAPIVWQNEDAFDSLLEIRNFDDEQIQVGRAAYWRFTENWLDEEIEDRLLIEKDPLLTCDLTMPLRLFPEAKIIMPLRDPRDVAVSYFFTMVPINWNSAPACSIEETARFYHDVMRHWLQLRDRLTWPNVETRYEDMVQDSVKETRRLIEFLELDWNEAILKPENRNSRKAISTPTYDDVSKPIYSRAAGRWMNYAKHLEPAMPILNQYAKEFGYE